MSLIRCGIMSALDPSPWFVRDHQTPPPRYFLSTLSCDRDGSAPVVYASETALAFEALNRNRGRSRKLRIGADIQPLRGIVSKMVHRQPHTTHGWKPKSLPPRRRTPSMQIDRMFQPDGNFRGPFPVDCSIRERIHIRQG